MEATGILSLVWVSDKVGAAFYDPDEHSLLLLPDTIDFASHDFKTIRSMFRHKNPRYVVHSARQDIRVISLLQSLSDATQPDRISADENADGENINRRCQILMLPLKDFSPDACRKRLQKQQLPEEWTRNHSDEEHLVFIQSLIPFHHPLMIRAAGALLRFLDKSSLELLNVEPRNGMVPTSSIVMDSMDDTVYIDDAAWSSLQIFTTDNNPHNNVKYTSRGTKEDLSVFKLLNRCVTAAGSKCLKYFLVHPLRNRQTLGERLEVIEHCISPANTDFVKFAKQHLKGTKSIPKVLLNIQDKAVHWKDLYQTLQSYNALIDLVSYQPQRILLYENICKNSRKFALQELQQELAHKVDFDESKKYRRFVPNQGLSELLDIRRRQYKSLPDIMTWVAKEEIASLPEYLNNCSIAYIPEVGFLLAISLWSENLSHEDLQIPRLEFKFSCNGSAYYKSRRTKELDMGLGDCIIPIIEEETSIMVQLVDRVLNARVELLEMYHLVAELDCLIAVATTACDYDFVKPEYCFPDNNEQMYDEDHSRELLIEDGRHPLVRLRCEVVPSTTRLVDEDRIVMITGPNTSGKSIYLKQVAITVMMALCGFYVPAAKARIPLCDQIFVLIRSVDSVSFTTSTFQQDLSHLSIALQSCTQNSLIIVDEFGKGTAQTDGLALLYSAVKNLLDQGDKCPFVFISTHYHALLSYLDVSARIQQKMMQFAESDNNIVFLYRIVDGISRSSFAFSVAHRYGVCDDVLTRAREVHNIISEQLGVTEITASASPDEIRDETFSNLMISLADLELQPSRLAEDELKTIIYRMKTQMEI